VCLEVKGFRDYNMICVLRVLRLASIRELFGFPIQEGLYRCVLEDERGLELGFRIQRGILILSNRIYLESRKRLAAHEVWEFRFKVCV